jgi:hypothetical protein
VFSGPSQRAAFSEDSLDPGLRNHVTNKVTLYQSKNIILARASVGVQVPKYLRVLGTSHHIRGAKTPATFMERPLPTWCCRCDASNDFNCTREGSARLTTIVLALHLPVAPLCSALSFLNKFGSTPCACTWLGFVLGLRVWVRVRLGLA